MQEKNSLNSQKKNCALIIDSTNTFLRGYASNMAMNDYGDHVGGVVSYLYTLKNFISSVYTGVNAVCCVWDGPDGSVRRRGICKEYKNGRKPPKPKNRFYQDRQESNSAEQQNMLIETLQCLPVRQFALSGVEADDVIAYIVGKIKHNFNVVILSTDHDYYQLVAPNVVIYNPVKKKFMKEQDIIKEHSIHPTNFALARSVIGDKTDNLQGINGIGYKTLAKYFPNFKEREFYTLSSLYEEAKKFDKPTKTLLKMIDGYGIIERNMKLMRLDHTLLNDSQKQEVECDMKEPVTSERYCLKNVIFRHGLHINSEALFDSTLPLLAHGTDLIPQ